MMLQIIITILRSGILIVLVIITMVRTENWLPLVLLGLLAPFHLVRGQESFILEEFKGYPMFREDEIRGKRTIGNIMGSTDSNNAQEPDIGRFDSYWDSSARKKSETFFTNEQVDKVLEEAFRDHPFAEDLTASVRNKVGPVESLVEKHSLDGSIPLSIIENERNGNPYQRDIVENELVESPFSDMDTGMAKGKKFRHKVI